MPSKIVIHGGIRFLGQDPGIENMDIEELSVDPVNPQLGRIWFNIVEKRIKYVESISPTVLRSIAHLDDIVLPVIPKIKAFYSGAVPIMSGTTNIPFDNTVPLITEGSECWTQTVTPVDIASKNIIEFSGIVDCSNGAGGCIVTIAIFRNSVFLGLSMTTLTKKPMPAAFSIKIPDPVGGSLTPITYSARIGIDTGMTWYLGRSVNATMGGGNKSGWSIMEVK